MREQIEALAEKNPARYRDMCVPHADADAATAAAAKFLEAVKAARIEHRISDAYVILTSRYIADDGEESEGLLTMHYGDELKAPLMVAHAYGSLRERQEEALARAVARRSKRAAR